MKVSKLFDVKYGTNLELNHLKKADDGINFVSRTSKNNGVSGIVEQLTNVEPLEAGLITVAGGGSVMSSFVQPKPFYSGRDVFYLKPKRKMSLKKKLFYCMCLRANRHKFSFGRQANQTLKDLEIPDKIPKWVNEVSIDEPLSKDVFQEQTIDLKDRKWKKFTYDYLFIIERGKGARKKDMVVEGTTPFVTSIDNNNGWTGKVLFDPQHNANVIGVNRNGSVGEAFYQPKAFCSTEDVHIFNPKFELNVFRALFLTTLIKMEKYRYSFGRKWGIKRMNETTIHLPVNDSNEPDWEFMEDYIKSLPYSSNL